jgi:hypothetical protein
MVRSVKSLVHLSTMSIEEAIGRLKVIDADEPQLSSDSVTIGGKLHFARKQWEVCRGDGKKGESSSTTDGRKRGKPRKAPGWGTRTCRGWRARRRPGWRRRRAQASTGRFLPQLWQVWPLGKDYRQPRRGQAHVAQAEEEELALLLAHTSIELPPAAPAAAALLHLDECRIEMVD